MPAEPTQLLFFLPGKTTQFAKTRFVQTGEVVDIPEKWHFSYEVRVAWVRVGDAYYFSTMSVRGPRTPWGMFLDWSPFCTGSIRLSGVASGEAEARQRSVEMVAKLARTDFIKDCITNSDVLAWAREICYVTSGRLLIWKTPLCDACKSSEHPTSRHE